MNYSTIRLLSQGFLLLFMSGCATSIAHMQTAKVVKKGSFEGGVGMSMPIAPSTFERLIDLGESAYAAATAAQNQDKTLSDADQRDLVEAGLGIIFFSPAPVTEFWGRYGLFEGVDFGVRWGGARLYVDGRFQFLRDDSDGIDAAVTLGYGHHSDTGPSFLKSISDVFKTLNIAEYGRKDIALDLALSRQRGWFGWYGALGYTLALTEVQTQLSQVEALSDLSQTPLSNQMHVIRAVVGSSLRWKAIWLRAEFAVARAIISPTILGTELDLSTWQVSPGLAVGFQW
ncbi:MAG TPA: hypothetical protein DCQ06_09785 [Myxococcales bacterium]|nr:hypothetical protein [Myxococcales bacterium]